MMAKAKMVDVRLREAEVKVTRLKKTGDGTPAYRKAKTELAFARQAYAEQRRAPNRDGDGEVKLEAVAAKATPMKKAR
jgi:hypothetical protein